VANFGEINRITIQNLFVFTVSIKNMVTMPNLEVTATMSLLYDGCCAVTISLSYDGCRAVTMSLLYDGGCAKSVFSFQFNDDK
jgi:hypothetical protein